MVRSVSCLACARSGSGLGVHVESRERQLWYPVTKNPDQIFFYYYTRVFLRVYTRTYSSTDDTTLYTYFETQTISYPDSASCVGILTESTTLFSDHHESGLSQVVCIGRNVIVYPYVHVCTLFSSTRLSRLKPQCFLDPEDTLRPWRNVYCYRTII